MEHRVLPVKLKQWLAAGPYLGSPGRLADLLAAIQVLGTYEFAARDVDKWARRLGRKPRSADTWSEVFLDHPEFFTLDDENKMALVWRRSFRRDYDTATRTRLSGDELEALKRAEKRDAAPARVSRKPLESEQIELLCNLAVNLHEREIQHRQEKRWWLAGVIAVTTALIAVIFD